MIDQRRKLASRQHVVADGHLVGGPPLAHALVNPLVAAAQHRDVPQGREPLRLPLRERPAGRRQQHHRARLSSPRHDGVHRGEQRLGFHHHPRTAAERHIVHDMVTIGREVAQVVNRDVQQPALPRPSDHAFLETRVDHPREDRDDVELHKSSSPSGGRTTMRRSGTCTEQISSASGISNRRCGAIHHQAALSLAGDRDHPAHRAAIAGHHLAADQLLVVVLTIRQLMLLGRVDLELRSGQAFRVVDRVDAGNPDDRPPLVHPKRRHLAHLARPVGEPRLEPGPDLESLVHEVGVRIHDHLSARPVRPGDHANQDQLVPFGAAARFRRGIGGPSRLPPPGIRHVSALSPGCRASRACRRLPPRSTTACARPRRCGPDDR